MAPGLSGGARDKARRDSGAVRKIKTVLVHYPNHGEWELFDLDEDPEQLNNVYGEDDYADAQQRLKDQLFELQEQYGDDTWEE